MQTEHYIVIMRPHLYTDNSNVYMRRRVEYEVYKNQISLVYSSEDPAASISICAIFIRLLCVAVPILLVMVVVIDVAGMVQTLFEFAPFLPLFRTAAANVPQNPFSLAPLSLSVSQ